MACVRISFAFKVHCCYFSVAKSCPTLLWLHGLHPVRLLCPWDFPGKNTGVSCHFLLQGNLPDPGIKPVSPALTSGFFTSVPPGKPKVHWLFNCLYILKATLHLQSLQSTGYIPCPPYMLCLWVEITWSLSSIWCSRDQPATWKAVWSHTGQSFN